MKILSMKKSNAPVSDEATPRYPGIVEATDGSAAVVHAETAASEAAGAYPITPSTQMGEGWAVAVAQGKTNANGRRLIFFEPEGEHAAAAVTAGMSMTGLRATNFSSGQGIAYMHESLYAAAGKRLTYVLNVAARAMTKQALNVHAGHDDYHAVDDSGFFQLFSKDVQEVADLTVIAHRIAELSLNPGLSAQDGFLTSHVIEDVVLPEPEMIREYLGDPSDVIESPTPAQRLVFGEKRRRIPEMFDLDYPAMFGVVQNQDSYAQGVAAQRPFYFDHVQALTDQAFEEYAALTGRRYARVQGYRMDDAEYVLVGQGSVVPNCEAVADWLREERGVKVGVVNLTMFRPFPADLVAEMLKGRKAVTVMERLDQPLAVDPPVLREIRAAMYKGLENHRAAGAAGGNGRRTGAGAGDDSGPRVPHPGIPPVAHEAMPDFYAAGFGFGSRDLQPGDIIATVENMLEGGRNQRHFYLGLEFIEKEARYPKLQIWQEQLLEAYPHLGTLALEPAENRNLMPEGSISIRIHSVGGWGAITMGKNVSLTAFELLGLHVKANPKYGSEKKGQPTTFYATLSPEPIRVNSELKHVDVVLSPDPNVFRNSDPLQGLSDGGVFVIQSDQSPEDLWASFPAAARRIIRDRSIKVYALDAFAIASEEASDADLRYRMQGTAFMGAFFKVSPLMDRHGLDEAQLFQGIEEQLRKKFGHRGERVVEDNVRVIRRGFDELHEVSYEGMDEGAGDEIGGEMAPPRMPVDLDVPEAKPGIGNPGRFWEQVCAFCATSGKDGIADPFAGIAAIPAATSSVRDMTDIRFEVPDFIAEKCTGCSQCWVQCPDAAIPGLVNTVDQVLDTAVRVASNGRPLSRFKQVQKHVAKEAHKVLEGVPFHTFGEVLSQAYENVAEKLGWDPERRKELDDDFAALYPTVAELPLAKTTPFFDLPERKDKGSGGLLSITVDPEACKGCNICVEVCPEEALITARQDDEILERLRRNWKFYEAQPDTDDRYINISNLEEGIGVLSSLLLKKNNYQSMAGGDGACMGCGEKTAVHLLVSTIEGVMQPRVENLVGELDELIEGLDKKARNLLGSLVDLDSDPITGGTLAEVDVTEEVKAEVRQILRSLEALKDLRWRYVEGPGGKGRSHMGIANSTGCSSVWGSTYPYNPYPFPWVNHLFQDAPSIAIGIFEGHMRKMADNFVAIRRARKILDDEYDAETDEAFFEAFDWRDFTQSEFELCPPIIAMGGDGAMLDIGFQNLSRLLASGKPLRVVVLDTQVYSNTGGQACTSGYTGQVADMSAYGKAQHGKEEVRKELGLIAMAHRGAYVLQSSQALPSHMIEGIIAGLKSRRPAVFNLYTPCPVEHGLADEMAPLSAKLSLESRAFPFFRFDPDQGPGWADCLDLSGNPEVDEKWPAYEFTYVDEDGNEQEMEGLPLTIADWAATEGRFAKQFRRIAKDDWDDDAQLLFHEYVDMPADETEGKTPFIWTLDPDRRLERLAVAEEIVTLARERLHHWHQLKEMAGLEVSDDVRDALSDALEAEFEEKARALQADYEARMSELRTRYPRVVARRMAEGLLRASGNGGKSVKELVENALASPARPVGPEEGLELGSGAAGAGGGGAGVPGGDASSGEGAVATEAPPAEEQPEAAAQVQAPSPEAPGAAQEAGLDEAEEADAGLAMEPYIDTELCTSCNDCLNINGKMFAYDDNKQAYIADATAGTYKELVQAAEKCPAGIIHPGDPLNPKEKDLDKWVKRAAPFN